MRAPASKTRVLAVVAGLCAMVASATTLGVIVWSDLAHASAVEREPVLSDELPVYKVTQSPRRVVQEEEVDLSELEDLSGELGKLKFGTFEGY